MDLDELHGVLLEILLEFDRVCRCNGIQYTLAYGTLLGAIRHKGFIPWDDDVDVIMDRKNFDKFCSVCPSEIGKDFFFQSKYTEPAYPYNICRLRKNNTAMIFEAWKKSGIHQGLFIDIYPVDNVPDSKIKRKLQALPIIALTPIRVSRNPIIYLNGASKRLNPVMLALKNSLYHVVKLFPKEKCDSIEKHYITKYDETNCRELGVICEGATLLSPDKTNIPFETKYLQEYTDVEFEGHQLMSVKNSAGLLTHWYGDYMQLPPEDKRVMYHHPEVFDTKKSYKEYI